MVWKAKTKMEQKVEFKLFKSVIRKIMKLKQVSKIIRTVLI